MFSFFKKKKLLDKIIEHREIYSVFKTIYDLHRYVLIIEDALCYNKQYKELLYLNLKTEKRQTLIYIKNSDGVIEDNIEEIIQEIYKNILRIEIIYKRDSKHSALIGMFLTEFNNFLMLIDKPEFNYR